MSRSIDISRLKKFRIEPKLPEKIQDLKFIAYNLWIAWNQEARRLFVRMDHKLWEKTYHNPVKMLGDISQERLEELAEDEGFCFAVKKVRTKLDNYLSQLKNGKENKIGYFSFEYGIAESLPLYSGGLGVLSGEHIKSSSDLNIELYGVGLLYQKGYFQQYLNQDGWQQDFYKINDFFNMQLKELKDGKGKSIEVVVKLNKKDLFLKVWEISVGRVKIYLLDTNIEKNTKNDRELTGQLYSGDREFRLKQEIILGIGGMRIFEKIGISLDVVHMNEGHSAFATIERINQLMRKNKLSYQEALEISKKSSIFTTHTPVPAGNDEFNVDIIKKYFQNYVEQLNISIEDFLKIGQINENNPYEAFSMTVAAIKNVSFINGVSKLHAEVAKKMWVDIWNDIPIEHVPIKAITNGIHTKTWISNEIEALFERYLGDKWDDKQDDVKLWEKVNTIPHPEIWSAHEIGRRRLIRFIRKRVKKQLINKGASKSHIKESSEVLNPEALTIGFARRFATYKRGDLLLRDSDRLLKILNNEDKPVQIVIAGKSHPQDNNGKEIIRKIVHFIKTHSLEKKIIFIEDYDMNVARYMVQGVDIWLNNPLRPKEACGTSGMKASVNGVLNLSVLDGWWDEAYDHTNGWAIGNGEEYENRDYQDHIESEAIYSILENDIVPLFYNRGDDNLPRDWISMMAKTFVSIVAVFNTQRMIKEYNEDFYIPAGENYRYLSSENYKNIKEFVKWKDNIRKNFNKININEIKFDEASVYKISDDINVSVELNLGEIDPKDINISVFVGRIVGDNDLIEPETKPLVKYEQIDNSNYKFTGDISCIKTGNFGFKIRITPEHKLMSNPYELNLVKWS